MSEPASVEALASKRKPKLEDMQRAVMLRVGSLQAWRAYYREQGRDLHPDTQWELASLEETVHLLDKLNACRAEVTEVFRRHRLEGQRTDADYRRKG